MERDEALARVTCYTAFKEAHRRVMDEADRFYKSRRYKLGMSPETDVRVQNVLIREHAALHRAYSQQQLAKAHRLFEKRHGVQNL